jgi:hypothetical protein
VNEGQESLAQTQAFIDGFRIPWPNGYGAGATIDALGVEGFPTTIVIGANGRIAWNNYCDGNLDQAIEKALASAKK